MGFDQYPFDWMRDFLSIQSQWTSFPRRHFIDPDFHHGKKKGFEYLYGDCMGIHLRIASFRVCVDRRNTGITACIHGFPAKKMDGFLAAISFFTGGMYIGNIPLAARFIRGNDHQWSPRDGIRAKIRRVRSKT